MIYMACSFSIPGILVETEKIKMTTVKAIGEAADLWPEYISNDGFVRKIHYAAYGSRFIINTVSDEILKKIGASYTGPIIEVENALEAASVAANIFNRNGFTATVIESLDPTLPKDFFTGVRVVGLQWILGFIKPISKEMLDQLPFDVKNWSPHMIKDLL